MWWITGEKERMFNARSEGAAVSTAISGQEAVIERTGHDDT